MNPRIPGREGGFTLIELLVALALTGLVSLLLLHGIGLASRGLDRLSHHAERLEQRRGLEMLLRHMLASAVSMPIFDGEPGFVGHPTSVSFLSAVEAGGAGLYRLKLAFDPAAATIGLTRRPASKSALPEQHQSVLMRRVQAFALGYFGALSPGDEPRWHRSWEGVAHPPQLLRIVLDAGDGVEHPSIVFRLPNGG